MKRKPLPVTPPQSLEECTTDAAKIDWLRLRVDQLEKENKAYREDPMYKTYFAEFRKANEIAESLNSFVLSLTSGDGTFERYSALVKMRPLQLKILDTIRREYLKQDEAALVEIEKTGVPLIERRVKK